MSQHTSVVDSLWKNKKRRKSSSASTGVQGVTPQHLATLGDAEQHFINAEYHDVTRILSSLIREAPKWSEPYTLLALTYDALQEKQVALQLFVLAASHQTKRLRSIDAWRKVAYFAYELKAYEQSYAAVMRCLRHELSAPTAASSSLTVQLEEPEDEDVTFTEDEQNRLQVLRMVLLVRLGKIRHLTPVLTGYLKSLEQKLPPASLRDYMVYVTIGTEIFQMGFTSLAIRYFKLACGKFGIDFDGSDGSVKLSLSQGVFSEHYEDVFFLSRQLLNAFLISPIHISHLKYVKDKGNPNNEEKSSNVEEQQENKEAEEEDGVVWDISRGKWVYIPPSLVTAPIATCVSLLETLFARYHALLDEEGVGVDGMPLPPFPLDLLLLLVVGKLYHGGLARSHNRGVVDLSPAIALLDPLLKTLGKIVEEEGILGDDLWSMVVGQDEDEDSADGAEGGLYLITVLLHIALLLLNAGMNTKALRIISMVEASLPSPPSPLPSKLSSGRITQLSNIYTLFGVCMLISGQGSGVILQQLIDFDYCYGAQIQTLSPVLPLLLTHRGDGSERLMCQARSVWGAAEGGLMGLDGEWFSLRRQAEDKERMKKGGQGEEGQEMPMDVEDGGNDEYSGNQQEGKGMEAEESFVEAAPRGEVLPPSLPIDEEQLPEQELEPEQEPDEEGLEALEGANGQDGEEEALNSVLNLSKTVQQHSAQFLSHHTVAASSSLPHLFPPLLGGFVSKERVKSVLEGVWSYWLLLYRGLKTGEVILGGWGEGWAAGWGGNNSHDLFSMGSMGGGGTAICPPALIFLTYFAMLMYYYALPNPQYTITRLFNIRKTTTKLEQINTLDFTEPLTRIKAYLLSCQSEEEADAGARTNMVKPHQIFRILLDRLEGSQKEETILRLSLLLLLLAFTPPAAALADPLAFVASTTPLTSAELWGDMMDVAMGLLDRGEAGTGEGDMEVLERFYEMTLLRINRTVRGSNLPSFPPAATKRFPVLPRKADGDEMAEGNLAAREGIEGSDREFRPPKRKRKVQTEEGEVLPVTLSPDQLHLYLIRLITLPPTPNPPLPRHFFPVNIHPLPANLHPTHPLPSLDRKILMLLDQFALRMHNKLSPLPVQSALQSAKLLLLRGQDISLYNLLAHSLHLSYAILQEQGEPRAAGVGAGSIEEALPLPPLTFITAQAFPLQLLTAYQEVLFKRHGQAMDAFLQALFLLYHQGGGQDGGQPLLHLCMGTYLLMLSTHPIMKTRQELLLKAFVFLTLYVQQRLERCAQLHNDNTTNTNASSSNAQTSSHSQHVGNLTFHTILAEVYYNLGRACQEVKQDHLAVIFYKLTFALTPSPTVGPVAGQPTLAFQMLQRKAAHNLVLIYMHSGAEGLALETMRKHLRFA
eukprot:gene24940-30134_t